MHVNDDCCDNVVMSKYMKCEIAIFVNSRRIQGKEKHIQYIIHIVDPTFFFK